jgi:hypothetical protein
VLIFRHVIFGNDPIIVLFIFYVPYFLGVRLLFLSCLYLVALFIIGTRCSVRFLVSTLTNNNAV